MPIPGQIYRHRTGKSKSLLQVTQIGRFRVDGGWAEVKFVVVAGRNVGLHGVGYTRESWDREYIVVR